MRRPIYQYLRIAAIAVILGLPPWVGAAETDLAPAPLGTAPSVSVLPNLMFVLDDSGSMARDFMPDEVDNSDTCKKCSSSSCNVADDSCRAGHPPYYANQFNNIYYNPQITYVPGVDDLGVSLGNAVPTAAKDNPYASSSSTKDVTTTWRELYFCTENSGDISDSELSDPDKCRRNGIDTDNPWFYKDSSSGTDFTGGLPTTTFRHEVYRDISNPFYYEITAREYCKSEDRIDCKQQAGPGGGRTVPAPLRWCRKRNGSDSAATNGTVSGGSPQFCQAKWSSTYRYPRLGNIKRTDIKPSVTSYGGRPNRSDCAAAPTCTYAEELQNFANWYSYYRERMLMMKTSAGRAFSALDDRFRLGFLTINSSGSDKYLKIDKFTPTHKKTWYDKFYSQSPSGSTPLREALARVGRHYGGVTGGINSFMNDEPVQYSCQQNFTILTTDGYWNSDAGQTLTGGAIGDQDNVDAGFSRRAAGAYDGNLGGTAGSGTGSADTLADVAMYYYKTDLRTTMKDNVPTTAKDTASHQHMVTFTLGLGLDGLMNYRPDYETALSGDFAKIVNGDPSGCSWTSGKCDWPQVTQNDPRTLDDLWHAAVNGRGHYFSAKDPTTLQTGITQALTTIQAVTGAAASSATSTPNITPTDNFIYSSTYRTAKWDGEVVAEKIDTVSGEIIPGIVWSAGNQLNARVSLSNDTRTIWTYTDLVSDRRVDFNYNSWTASHQAVFDNKCSALPQCSTLSFFDQLRANDGENLVDWLRGQSGNSDIFRARENVLGDTVNSKPAFVGEPDLQYADAVTPDYNSFKTANASRQGVLYVAANDGMLHAFNGDTGKELWAWVPRMIRPEMYKLAVNNYDVNHRYFVDGSPAVMDVFFKSKNAWKTVLVAGLNSGGRGFFALDVTDPFNPKGLWEVCADPTGALECTAKDDNIGFSYAEPVITKWAKDPTKWVAIVSSGYNNITPGDGKGYIFVIDIEDGTILDTVTTNVGDTTTPSGLAKLTGFAQNFQVDNTTTFVYGGDLEGNVWRFDMTSMGVQRIAQLFDGSSPPKPQSVTTKVEVTEFDAGFKVIYVGTGRLLGTSDLPDPATLSPPEDRAYQQTVYGFKDTGADLGNLHAPAANLVEQTITVVDGTTRTISNNAVDWTTQNGWYVDLNPANDSPGERVTIHPQLVKGVLLVLTNEPNAEPCVSGGNSFAYQFDYRTGSYVASATAQVVGVKLSPALAAGVVVYRLPGGQMKYSAIDVRGTKVVGGINPGAGGTSGKRVSWRELIY